MTRDDLAKMAYGVAAELGVAAGEYSATLLERGDIAVLYSIDRWADHHDEKEYQCACKRLSEFGCRSRIVRASFSEAVNKFPDEYFSLVYIDGYAHTGQDGGRTLRDWWPKLKSGGIFAGHDYSPQFQPTIDAVDVFAAEHGLKVNLTTDDALPSWWVVKP